MSQNHRQQGTGLLWSAQFWALIVMVGGIALLHYATPQVRRLSSAVNLSLSRHTVERVLFLLPVALATSSFGYKAGSVTLAFAIFIMVPRAVWLSAHPVDATLEIAAVSVVGYIVLSMIDAEEQSLRQQVVARMRSFNAMCSIVAKSLELEQVLHETLEKALEVAHLDAGWMCTFDRQSGQLILRASRALNDQTVQDLKRCALEEGLCGPVARSGEPVVLESLSPGGQLGQSEQQIAGLARAGLEALVIVPLLSKGEVQGVMALGSRKPRKFPPADLQLITTFGKQIGVGVENAQLHRDIERRLGVQRRLNEVAEQITSELELDRILPKVLQIAEGLTGADCGFIALLDPATGRLTYPYLHNLPQSLKGVTVATGEGAAGETLSKAEPGVISDYRAYHNAVPAFVDAGLVSVVAVPILTGSRAFGTLAVGTLNEYRQFSTTEVSTLANVGRQAGIAIDNARLYQNMRYYARQITRAQEDERRRIAREVHDETAQILVALSRRLDGLRASLGLPSDVAERRLDQAQALATEALRSVRRLSRDLRPPVLDDLGFLAAIRGLARDLRESGVATDLRVTGSPYRMSPEDELVLFRIAQESLNNVRRHANATRAWVHVLFRPDAVRMAIEDDGRGFETPDKFVDLVGSGRLGLVGMHERARILGGTLCIESSPGQGTKVMVDAPVKRK